MTDTIKAVINLDIAGPVISRHIYGHFAEHLGDGIYGGFYVGDDSTIPNDQGIRLDVVEALQTDRHTQPPLAGRLLRRRVPLEGRHRSQRRPALNRQQPLG